MASIAAAPTSHGIALINPIEDGLLTPVLSIMVGSQNTKPKNEAP